VRSNSRSAIRLKGATIPYYDDPNNPLPTLEEQASGSTPGWEDWDEDGQPGITAEISGGVMGRIFFAIRAWYVLSGTVADTSHVLKLAVDWDQEMSLLGYEGSELLTSQGARAADATLHFAQLARLAPMQVAGDDESICEAVRELAPSLTPEAYAD
jgi:hypothetical protein